MEADVQVKLETLNSCCASWKNKYAKLEEKRNALRQAVKLLDQQIIKIQAQAKKVCDEERARAEFEKQGKEKESAARLALENEIAVLKSEILSITQKRSVDVPGGRGNDELKLLQDCISEREKEIVRLKEAVQSERKRVDSEKKNAEVEKKKASEAQKFVEAERIKMENEINIVKLEKERAEKYKIQMDLFRKEADAFKSKVASETLKLKEANKKLEAEKQNTIKEKKRADLEKGKAEEQRKIAEVNKKCALEGKIYAESLSRRLEESKKRIDEAHDKSLILELSSKLEEANKKLQSEKQKVIREKERADVEMSKVESQRKIAEINLKKAMEEKSRADQVCKQLEEDKKMFNELEKKLHELSSSRKLIKPSARSNAESTKLKLLKKELKLEKMKKKHSNKVAELERSRNSILQQEVGRLKLEFEQFSGRLNLLHKYLPPSSEGLDVLGKIGDTINRPRSDMKNLSGSGLIQTCLQSPKELLKPSFPASDASGSLRQTVHHTAHLCPLPGGYCVEPITGIDSKLGSLLGGSTRTLKSPAINSSTASFSNPQLVGSQDKGASVTTSEKLVEEYAQPTVSGLSDEVTEMRSSENLAVVAENSIRDPVCNGDMGKFSIHRKKRKRILDTVETIENLYLKEKDLHLQIEEKLAALHGTLKKQMDKGFREGKVLLPNFIDSSGGKHDKHKKRKPSFHEEVVMQHVFDISKPKEREEVKLQVDINANLCRESSVTGVAGKMIDVNQQGLCHLETMLGFEEVADGDYMNLLNLNDAVFEEYYRLAMETPLSPTLPEIEILCDETASLENTISSVKDTSCEEFLNKQDKVLLVQGFDSAGVEISTIGLRCSGTASLDTSKFGRNESPANALGTSENIHQTSNAGVPSGCLSRLGVEVTISNATASGDEKSQFQSRSEFYSLSKKDLEHCLVFSNSTDRSSISRMYHAIRTCISECSLTTQTKWMIRQIFLAINMEEKLLPKEKVSALFSLLMINFSVSASGKFGEYSNWATVPCMDSFAAYVHEAMSDVEIRNLFAQLSCMDELLSLIENFLVDESFTVLRPSFGSPNGGDSSDNIHIDGSNVTLSSKSVSTEEFVAGSIILASICSALDKVGFICETTYNILRACRLSNSLMLSIFHIFAHLGGEKFFSLSDYSLMMTVLKPIVWNMEALSLSCDSAGGAQTQFHRCVKCPFLDEASGVVSMVNVAALLLEKINENKAETMNHFVESCSSKNDLCGIKSDALSTMTLFNLSDLLGLLELVACYMGWEWTSINIVPQLLKFLELHVFTEFTSGVIILLGQLGRLGVVAFGHEDKTVEQLRSGLSAFLRGSITMKAGLPIQIATVTALRGLISVDFEMVLQAHDKHPVISSHSVTTDLMREWFSTLNKKQQDLCLNILQTSIVYKS